VARAHVIAGRALGGATFRPRLAVLLLLFACLCQLRDLL
jgi:hypothetical protein